MYTFILGGVQFKNILKVLNKCYQNSSSIFPPNVPLNVPFNAIWELNQERSKN